MLFCVVVKVVLRCTEMEMSFPFVERETWKSSFSARSTSKLLWIGNCNDTSKANPMRSKLSQAAQAARKLNKFP